MTARRVLLLALAALVLLAAAACMPSTSAPGTAALASTDAPQPRTAPASDAVCMITVTKDGKTAYYKASPGQTLTVPNGTAKPFRAACHDGGWLTTEPGSGSLPW